MTAKPSLSCPHDKPDYELAERIHALAAEGLKVRDISSLLHIHPQIVIRVLETLPNRCVTVA